MAVADLLRANGAHVYREDFADLDLRGGAFSFQGRARRLKMGKRSNFERREAKRFENRFT